MKTLWDEFKNKSQRKWCDEESCYESFFVCESKEILPGCKDRCNGCDLDAFKERCTNPRRFSCSSSPYTQTSIPIVLIMTILFALCSLIRVRRFDKIFF